MFHLFIGLERHNGVRVAQLSGLLHHRQRGLPQQSGLLASDPGRGGVDAGHFVSGSGAPLCKHPKHDIEVPHRGLEAFGAELRYQSPSLFGQQPFPHLLVAAEKEPVLRRDHGIATALGREGSAPLDKHCREVRLRFRVVDVSEVPQGVVLLSGGEVWRVGGHQRVTRCQQRPGSRHALGVRPEDRRRRVVAALRQRRLQQRRDLGVVRLEHLALRFRRVVRVDKAAQVRRVLEYRVEPFERGLQAVVAPGKLRPLAQLPANGDAGAGNIRDED